MSTVPIISTGEPSILKTYRTVAYILDGFQEGKAVAFIDAKIAESPNRENEVVLADECQMLHILTELGLSTIKGGMS